MIAQTTRAILFAMATLATRTGFLASNARRRGSAVSGLYLARRIRRGRADHKELSQIPVAHLGDAAEPVLAAARVLRRCQPEPGGKLSTRAELSRIGNRGGQRCGADRANARNGR